MPHSYWLSARAIAATLAATLAIAPLCTPAIADVLDAARTARKAAEVAEAPRLAAERWEKAEKELATAQRKLDNGDAVAAAERGTGSELAFRDAELQALRSRYLSGVQTLLIEAGEAKAKRFAPRTLASAEAKLAAAEARLEANRSAPDKAAASIEAARIEASRAGRIARLARQLDDGGASREDTILEFEATFARIAAVTGLPATTIAGDDAAAAALVDGARKLRNRAESAERELAERDRQIVSLEEELREMDQQLGTAATERDQLVMTLEAQRRAREQFAALQALFTPEQGVALRQGNDVILRLTGLRFRSGSAELSNRSLPLLDKVREAIGYFPRAVITIEGHTDSSGGDAANQQLSEERAQSVARGLVNNLASGGVASGRPYEARGYGETRPVASNDTETGRASNRRIDVIIATREPGWEN